MFILEATQDLALNATKKSVYKYAEEISKQLNYTLGHESLEKIVKKLKGKITYGDPVHWRDTQSGSLIVSEDGFEITISDATPVTRDMFTIAHELGHYFLHADYGDIIDDKDKLSSLKDYDEAVKSNEKLGLSFKRYDSNKLEWEANWFAAGFLMPDYLLDEVEKEYPDDFGSITAHFGVSPEAMQYRLDYRR